MDGRGRPEYIENILTTCATGCSADLTLKLTPVHIYYMLLLSLPGYMLFAKTSEHVEAY